MSCFTRTLRRAARLLPGDVQRCLRPIWNNLCAFNQFRREKQFYRRFVSPGDLVFDVGANIGLKSKAFLAIGARVIAVEPNEAAVDKIIAINRANVRARRLIVEPVAVGRTHGELDLTIFERESAMASGFAPFVEYAHRTLGGQTRTVRVQAVTLDELVRRHGTPLFVKVDLEGMDADALASLTTKPRFLSFEFNMAPELWTNTIRCIDEALRLGFREANFTEKIDPKFVLISWVPLSSASEALCDLFHGTSSWGDVLVR